MFLFKSEATKKLATKISRKFQILQFFQKHEIYVIFSKNMKFLQFFPRTSKFFPKT